jgi:hypothetical protein
MTNINTVYVLHHVRSDDTDDTNVKLIGIYRTREAAEAAIARLSQLLGFRDYPDGFHVGAYELDKDHWVDGFVTVEPSDEIQPNTLLPG